MHLPALAPPPSYSHSLHICSWPEGAAGDKAFPNVVFFLSFFFFFSFLEKALYFMVTLLYMSLMAGCEAV